jgi:hypothetical protein
MSAAKKKSAPPPPANSSGISAFFGGWGKHLCAVVFLMGLFAAAGYAVWQKVREKVLSSEEYQLTAEKIAVTPWPPPTWVTPDPRKTVYDQLRRRGPVSILDGSLRDRITAAFEQNPWVAKVYKVGIEYPAVVKVELDFRRPVMMVQIHGPGYPVDAEGILLPGEGFTSVEAAKYPRLVGVETEPKSEVLGKRWGDSRVVGGAEIAAAFSLPQWEKLHLKRIVPLAVSPAAPGVPAGATQSARFGEYHFEIIAQGSFDEKGKANEKHIYWGKSPADKNSSDISAAQKVKKLEDLAAEKGDVDKWPDRIDLNGP